MHLKNLEIFIYENNEVFIIRVLYGRRNFMQLLFGEPEEDYNALMHTVAGKLVLAVCGFAIIITGLLMFRYTKPIEYRK